MLHDTERNIKYRAAIEAAVRRALARQSDPSVPVQVLDIGTGTGLLAMMAARAATDTDAVPDPSPLSPAPPRPVPSPAAAGPRVVVVAAEVFSPMVAIANEAISRNGLGHAVTVVPKRSTDMAVPADMPRRADVVVSEILDTELIGEGVLETMRHAKVRSPTQVAGTSRCHPSCQHSCRHSLPPRPSATPSSYAIFVGCPVPKFSSTYRAFSLLLFSRAPPRCGHKEHLLAENAAVIPASAAVYVQLVQSKTLHQWHDLSGASAGRCSLEPSRGAGSCAAAHSVHAAQLESHLTPLSAPVAAHSFDLANPELSGSSRTAVQITATGTVHAVLFWWVTALDDAHSISTAPPWVDGSPGRNWRDHWTQAVHLLPSPVEVAAGSELGLLTTHDEYTIWFDLAPDAATPAAAAADRPISSSAHTVWNPNRIWQLNDKDRERRFVGVVGRLLDTAGTSDCVITLGDGGYLGLMTAGEIAFRAAQAKTAAAVPGAAAAAVSDDHLVSAARTRTSTSTSTSAMEGTKVYSLETSMMSKRLVDKLAAKNKVRSVMTVFDASIEDLARADIGGRRVHALIAEPYYYNALLPWHGLQFWYVCQNITKTSTLNTEPHSLHPLPTREHHRPCHLPGSLRLHLCPQAQTYPILNHISGFAPTVYLSAYLSAAFWVFFLITLFPRGAGRRGVGTPASTPRRFRQRPDQRR